MARPRKEDALDATSYVGGRVHKDLRRRLEEKAVANGRSLTDELREALEAHVREKPRRRSRK